MDFWGSTMLELAPGVYAHPADDRWRANTNMGRNRRLVQAAAPGYDHDDLG